MRAKAPVLRSEMIRLRSRPPANRRHQDRKLLFWCMAAGLSLAIGLHDPAGFRSFARQVGDSLGTLSARWHPPALQAARTLTPRI